MKKLRGVLTRSLLEGGLWFFQTRDGERYHLSGLNPELEEDGAQLEVEGEVSTALGIGMMGTTLEVRSARRLRL